MAELGVFLRRSISLCAELHNGELFWPETVVSVRNSWILRSRGFPGRYGPKKDGPSWAFLRPLRGMLQKCHMLQRGMLQELIAEVTECFKARAAMRQGKACVSSRLRRADGISAIRASLSRGLRLKMISSSAESVSICSAVSGVRRGSGRRRRSLAAEFETRDFIW